MSANSTSDSIPAPALQRSWIEAALASWHGGSILVSGLADPEIPVEISRRGAAVIGSDPDPALVEAASARNAERGGGAVFLRGPLESARAFLPSRADVALVLSLPEGGERTLVLEEAMEAARCVIVPEDSAGDLPERFAALARPAAGAASALLALGDETAVASIPFEAREIQGSGDRTPGERAADEGFTAALAMRKDPRASSPIVVAFVRDHGHDAQAVDSGSAALREPDRAAAAATVATRTDRFSAEHVETLSTLDEVWVPSSWHAACLFRSGLERSRIRIVPDAVDTQRFRPRLKGTSTFRVLAMASNPRRLPEVVCAARAFADELGSDPRATLEILCGPDVEPRTVLLAVVGELRADPSRFAISIVPAKPRAEMPAYYATFDLFLRPSRGERRGMALLEAMACGLPVAATRFGIAALLVHDRVGYCVEPLGLAPCDPCDDDVAHDDAGGLRPLPSPESVRAALRSAFQDRAGRLARAVEARRVVAEHHSLDAVAQRMSWSTAPTTVDLETAPAGAHPASWPLAGLRGPLGESVLVDDGNAWAPIRADLETAAAAREVWCVSPLSTLGWIAAGIPAARVRCAPPAVDGKAFHPKVRAAVLPTRARFRVLVDARTDFSGGSDLALRAFAQAEIRDAALVVRAASRETRASLERLAATFERPIEMVFVADPDGTAAQASLYKACDVLLDLSRGPSTGRSVLEAAACGRPAVAVAASQPTGTITPATGYPVAARLRVQPFPAETFAVPPVVAEAWPEEAALLLRRCADDGAGRERRGTEARELALAFGAGLREAWCAERVRQLGAEAPSTEPTVVLVAPRGASIPALPSGVQRLELDGSRVQGGLAAQLGRVLERTTADVLVFASGSFEAQGQWLRELVDPFDRDPATSLALARDGNGAIVALRTRRLRSIAFAQGFETPAFVLDLVRTVVAMGDRIAPVSRLDLAFARSTPQWREEVRVVEWIAAAVEALAQGDVEKMMDALTDALEKLPSCRAAHDLAAGLFEGIGETETALDSALAAARIAPRDPAAHVHAGCLLARMGRDAEAAKRLRTALRMAPDQADVATALGTVLARSGNVEEAADSFLTALTTSPDHVEAAMGAADALERLGRAQEALDLLLPFASTSARPAAAVVAP